MKTAVFGGTFDPVHTGHIKMAQSAVEEFGLDKLIVVPNANPPHKKNEVNTDYSHRYNMLCLAFENIDKVEISDYESRGDRYYYSVDTMRHFRKIYGDDTCMIIGGDSLLTLHLWYEHEAFIKENKLIVFTRHDDALVNEAIENYRQKGATIFKAQMPHVDVSSTGIRSLLLEGIVKENTLSPKVVEYIKHERLYGDNL